MKKKRDNSSVMVPKSILFSTSNFDLFEWRVVLVLVAAVQEYMYMGERITQNNKVPQLALQFSAFLHKNYKREEVFAKLSKLRTRDIKYRVTSDSSELFVSTGLFSSVLFEPNEGGVYVVIMKEAIPWLLYLGRGYSMVDTSICMCLRSLYVLRLYLYLHAMLYRGGADFSLSIEEVRDILGIDRTSTMTTSQIQSRIFDVLKKQLEGSGYNFSYKFDTRTNSLSRRGRREISRVGIKFMLPEVPTSNQEVRKSDALNILQQCYSLRPRRNLRPLPDIVNDVWEKPGAMDSLIVNYNYYRNLGYKDMRLARTLLLILEDRLEIKVQEGKELPILKE